MKLQKILLLTFFITLFSCTEENYYLNDDDGKVNVYIEESLTNAEAQAKLLAEIGTQTENIYVQNTTLLTDIVINTANTENLRGIYIDDNNAQLRNITLQGNNTKISQIIIKNSKQNTNILIEGYTEANIVQIFTYGYKFDEVTGWQTGTTNTTNIVCNDLVKIKQNFNFIASIVDGNNIAFNDLKIVEANNPTYYWCYWRGKFDNISLPKLEEMSNLKTSSTENFTNVPEYNLGLSIENLILPELKKMGEFYLIGQTGINHFIAPKLKTLKAFYSRTFYYPSYNTYETTDFYNDRFQFPLLESCNGIWIEMPNFESTYVNSYLNKFLTLQPVSGKTIRLLGEAPTGQGIIDKQTLIDNGNFVETN